MTTQKLAYKRILLKLSGEALQSDRLGIDTAKLKEVSEDIAALVKSGVEVALVIGGGNLIRGADFSTTGFHRVTADQMGMLATVINALALQEALSKKSLPVTVMSAIAMPGLVDIYHRHHAIKALENRHVVIFAGGTGNPLVTTDSAAALRGIEIGADILLKATKVDGVFSKDPIKHPNAERFTRLTYDEVIEKRLGVMDLNAILLCEAHGLPLRIFNMSKQHALQHIVEGEKIGTLIEGTGE